MTETSILVEAEAVVNGPRQADYGSPYDNHLRIAKLWAATLGVPISPGQVALCMMQVKIARLMQSPTHRDSALDIAGYAWVHRSIEVEAAARILHPHGKVIAYGANPQ